MRDRGGFPGGTSGKEPACQCRRHKRRRFDPWVRRIPLEEGRATHSSILAWRIPWTVEPGGLQSMGSQRIGYDWATNTFILSRQRGAGWIHSWLWGVVCSSLISQLFLLKEHSYMSCLMALWSCPGFGTLLQIWSLSLQLRLQLSLCSLPIYFLLGLIKKTIRLLDHLPSYQ